MTNARQTDVPAAVMAPLQRRFFAKVLDGLLFGLPGVIIYTVAHSGDASPEKVDIDKLTAFFGGVLVLSALHDFFGVALWGQTLGKFAMGIKVRRAADGGLPGWTASGLRVLSASGPQILGLLVLGTSPGAYGLVDDLLGLRRPLHQCLHDMLARTVVVDERVMAEVWKVPAPSSPRWDPPPPTWSQPE